MGESALENKERRKYDKVMKENKMIKNDLIRAFEKAKQNKHVALFLCEILYIYTHKIYRMIR